MLSLFGDLRLTGEYYMNKLLFAIHLRGLVKLYWCFCNKNVKAHSKIMTACL